MSISSSFEHVSALVQHDFRRRVVELPAADRDDHGLDVRLADHGFDSVSGDEEVKDLGLQDLDRDDAEELVELGDLRAGALHHLDVERRLGRGGLGVGDGGREAEDDGRDDVTHGFLLPSRGFSFDASSCVVRCPSV